MTRRIAATGRMMRRLSYIAAASIVASFGASMGAAAAEPVVVSPLKDRTIGYVLTSIHFAFHTTEKAAECPEGFNGGPREQYVELFPKDGTQRNYTETALKRETAVWFPKPEPDPFKFKEPVSKIAPGFNLDGKVDADDFESADGEKGIDNQFYRAYGCVEDLRPAGFLDTFQNKYMRQYNYSRTLVELTDVDSLVNDDDVSVSFYRGLDPLVTDATGNEYLPYGSQRIDERWGKKFTQHTRGKIVDGVLITEPADVSRPYTFNYSPRVFYTIRGARLKLSLTEERGEGLLVGYMDVWSWYRAVNGALSTYSLAFGKQSAPSLYQALYRLADGYPDPETGKNTAISVAQEVSFRQVYIKRRNPGVASKDDGPRTTAQAEKASQKASR